MKISGSGLIWDTITFSWRQGGYRPKYHSRHPSPDNCTQPNMNPDCQLPDRDVLYYSKVVENRPMFLNSGNYKERSARGLNSGYIMQPRCINWRITTKNLVQDFRSPGRYINKICNYTSYSLCTYSHLYTHLSVRHYAPSPAHGMTVLERTATLSTYAKMLCLTQTYSDLRNNTYWSTTKKCVNTKSPAGSAHACSEKKKCITYSPLQMHSAVSISLRFKTYQRRNDCVLWGNIWLKLLKGPPFNPRKHNDNSEIPPTNIKKLCISPTSM